VNPEQIFPQQSSQKSAAVLSKKAAAARFSPPTQI